MIFIKRWLAMVAIIGGIVSMVTVVVSYAKVDALLGQAELIMFFGVAVVVPASLRAVLQPDRNGQINSLLTFAALCHPIAILAVGVSLVVASTSFSAALALIWLFQAGVIALIGLSRLLARPKIAIEEICIDVGLFHTPISGVWFVAYSADIALMTFSPILVLLTAIHFVYISLGTLVTIGMIGRLMYETSHWAIYRRLGWILVFSPMLVAVGITLTQYTGFIALEALAAFILSGTLLLLALLINTKQLNLNKPLTILLRLSFSTLFITMAFSLAYSIGRFTGIGAPSIPEMIQWHGWFNAIGFAFLSLLIWNLTTVSPHVSLTGIPYSMLPWRQQIHADFFDRINAIDNMVDPTPTGILDTFDDYQRPDFDPAKIAPEIRAFYENTAAHDLIVYAEWQTGFLPLARLYKRFSQSIGQMNFPLAPETSETHITSRIVPLRDALDSREQVRGWIRVYTKTSEAIYVAAYAKHRYNEQTYMNIAFPLPLGNLTSILKLNLLPEQTQGLCLTSFSTRTEDQGVYFSTRWLTVRLPLNETIEVYPPDTSYDNFPESLAHGTVTARHQVWLFGRHLLTLHYSITPHEIVN